MNADVAELADSAVLSRLLAQRGLAAQRGRVAVTFACGTRIATASAGDAPAATRSPLG